MNRVGRKKIQMKTYQQYIQDKENIKKENFRLAFETMLELESMAANARDADWHEYRDMVHNDLNRLAMELPVLFVKGVWERVKEGNKS
jgi:hypothetical protein